jgi:hypothetical protein
VQGLPKRPADGSGESLTGFTCPDCQGSIELVAEGELVPPLFRCRIGHTFTSTELLMGKEDRVEYLAWALLTSLEELAALLVDLDQSNDPSTQHAQYQNRIERVSRQIACVRTLIDGGRPVVLEEPDHPQSQGAR